jgi:peptidoglycan/LPS O-acetylase OafA/YrhL
LEYLGLISCSFYLWQFIAMELGEELVKIYPDISVHLIFLAAFTANLAVSALSYHLVEERARKFILAKFARKSP